MKVNIFVFVYIYIFTNVKRVDFPGHLSNTPSRYVILLLFIPISNVHDIITQKYLNHYSSKKSI